jgi:hypothetical protein
VASNAINGTPALNDQTSNVATTNPQANPWWQVDLGSENDLSEIDVYNRTDCCASRLTGYDVFVSTVPFNTSLTLAEQESQPGVTFHITEATQAGNPTVINLPGNPVGRYVMIQLFGQDVTLNLAQVVVKGTPPSTTPDPPTGGLVDWAQSGQASQSSTWGNGLTSNAGFAIDGNPVKNDESSDISATNNQTNPWWQVDLGSSHSLSGLVVNNRTDCCASRLENYDVFVTNSPLDVNAQSTFASLQAEQEADDPNGFSQQETSQALPVTPIALGANAATTSGEYVTVVLLGQNQTLNLAGVSAIGPS